MPITRNRKQDRSSQARLRLETVSRVHLCSPRQVPRESCHTVLSLALLITRSTPSPLCRPRKVCRRGPMTHGL